MLVSSINSDPYSILAATNRPETALVSYKQAAAAAQTSAVAHLAQVSMSSQTSDLNLVEDKTSFAYYTADNSTALRAESQTELHLHQETTHFEITFSAEALGLTQKDFANGKPMVLKFSFQQTAIDYQSQVSVQVTNQVRSPQDVISDLANALRDVLSDGNNKSVDYVLDDAARQALLSDPKIMKLANELILLMATINLAKKQGAANHYTIYVSGKANPRVDLNEKTSLESQTKTVDFTITINPPGGENQAVSTAAPVENVPQNQPANVNVTV